MMRHDVEMVALHWANSSQFVIYCISCLFMSHHVINESMVSLQFFGGLPTASVFAKSACIALPAWAVVWVQPPSHWVDIFGSSLGHPGIQWVPLKFEENERKTFPRKCMKMCHRNLQMSVESILSFERERVITVIPVMTAAGPFGSSWWKSVRGYFESTSSFAHTKLSEQASVHGWQNEFTNSSV